MNPPIILPDPVIPGVTRVAADPTLPRPHAGVIGAIHGNERCGMVVIERLLAAFASGASRVAAGTLVLVHGSPAATAIGERHTRGGTDLNRLFDYEFVDALAPDQWTYEHHRAVALRSLLDDIDVLLDLHSATTPTPPVAIVNTVPASLALAERLGVSFVVSGWDAPGLLLSRVSIGALGQRGRPGIAVECGQHDDPATIDAAEACTRRFLAAVGAVPGTVPTAGEGPGRVRVVEALDRPSPTFRFARRILGMERLAAGEVIGFDTLSEVRVRQECRAVLPMEDAPVGGNMIYLAVDE